MTISTELNPFPSSPNYFDRSIQENKIENTCFYLELGLGMISYNDPNSDAWTNGVVLRTIMTTSNEEVLGKKSTAIETEEVNTFVERNKLTITFISKMRELFSCSSLSPKARQIFLHHPRSLIALVSIAMAFHSRSLQGSLLLCSGKKVLGHDLLQQAEDGCAERFEYLCAMKDSIQRLNLGPDDLHAWETLISMLSNKEIRESSGPQGFAPHVVDSIVTLRNLSENLAEVLSEEKIFKYFWELAR